MKIKEEEIKKKQQLIKILEKDNKKLKKSFNEINVAGIDGGNSLRNRLIQTNLKISEFQNTIKNYKIKMSEHTLCEKKIKYLNKMITDKNREILSKKNDVIKKDDKYNKLNSEINVADKALELIEENKVKKKLKLKQKNHLLNLSKENIIEQSPIKTDKNTNYNYIKTIPSKNNNKNQIIKNKIGINKLNLNNNYYLKSHPSTSSNKNNIIYPYTEEEKNKAISIFTEEEKEIIMEVINHKKERYNTLIEKLIVLERFRNTKKKQLKVRQRRDIEKLKKIYEQL